MDTEDYFSELEKRVVESANATKQNAGKNFNKFGIGFIVTIFIVLLIFITVKSNNATQNSTQNSPNAITALYTTTATNIRECPSLNCKIIGKYPPNTNILASKDLGSYSNISHIYQLPEWIMVNFTPSQSSGKEYTGYINSGFLSLSPVTTSSSVNNTNGSVNTTTTVHPDTISCNGTSYSKCPIGQDFICPADGTSAHCQVPQQLQPSKQMQQKTLSGIIKEWRKSTTYIACFWTYSNGNVYYSQSGSGLAVMLNLAPTIITNHHVVYSSQYGGANECDVRFPDDSGFYVYSSNTPMTGGQGYFLNKGNISYPTNLDVAYVTGIENTWISLPFGSQNYPTVAFINRIRSDAYLCKSPLDIGNPIVILGYPVYGTQIRQGALSPVEITATEGIISGQDSGYYTTSAKIDHGNSGGLAIDKDNNCYFGIPTWDLSGSFESLGRILPALSFLNY